MQSVPRPGGAAAAWLRQLGRDDLAALMDHVSLRMVPSDNEFGPPGTALEVVAPLPVSEALRMLAEFDHKRLAEAALATLPAEKRPAGFERVTFADYGEPLEGAEALLAELIVLREQMIQVAVSKAQIADVDDYYKARRRRVAVELQKRSLEDPNPFTDLWQWFHRWKADFPTYKERRAFVRELYSPLIASVLRLAPRASSEQSPSPWKLEGIAEEDVPLRAELGDRFTFHAELGSGSFATVYLVTERDTSKRFALKVVNGSKEARDRALRELDAALGLQHGNILPAIEHHAKGRWFLLPLADGTLGQLHYWERIGPADARTVALEVGAALVHAHGRGFLHRDLHIDNILRHDGAWKVADWGLTVAQGHQQLTQTKSRGGNVNWTAPEQLARMVDASEVSDLYSLGRVVGWLASGKLPEPGKPTALPESNPLAEFVRATTQLDKLARPASVALALDLIPRRGSIVTAPRVDGAPKMHAAGPSPEVPKLVIDYVKRRITQEHHDYELHVEFTNTSRARLDDWEVEVDFPSALLTGDVRGTRVDSASTASLSKFRLTGSRDTPLRPGEVARLRLAYFVNNEMYWTRNGAFLERVTARAAVDGAIVAEAERPLEELQDF